MEKLKISELIKEKNISFNLLAEMIGVKRTTLIYNLSKDKIQIKYLIDIAKALEVEVSDLIFEEEDIDISGYMKYDDNYYNLSDINEFVAFLDILVKQCGLESNLYYTPKTELVIV